MDEQLSASDLTKNENTVKAKVFKELGNEEFNSKNYSKSIEYYTRAINLYGLPLNDRSILYSNRCISYLKLNQLENAMKDAEVIQSLRPQWWKGYYRMAQIYYAKKGIEFLSEAKKCLLIAESYERNNEISELLNEVKFQETTLKRDTFMELNFINFTIDSLICSYETNGALKAMRNIDANNPIIRCLEQSMEYCNHGHSYMARLDYKNAMQCYKMAGERGSAEGYYFMAQIIVNGMGMKKDYGLALEYYLKAAEQPPYIEIGKRKFNRITVAMSEHAIGYYYELGIVVKKDIKEALKWYQRAFDHKFYASANTLGLHNNDLAKREQLLKCAAKKGDERAMKNLAVMYFSRNDPNMALKWCKWIKQNGYYDQHLAQLEIKAEFMLLVAPNNQIKRSTYSKEIYLKDPYRIDIINKHRQLVNMKPILYGDYDAYNGFASMISKNPLIKLSKTYFGLCPKNQKTRQLDNQSDNDLNSISMNDMNPTLDHIYNGCIIDLKSIDIVSSIGSTLFFVVEDNDKNVERCFIYNSPLINDINKANQLYGIGCQFIVINPYMRIAIDFRPGIRIDNINSIVMRDFIKDMCRYCCESNATKVCSRCKTAMYCSRECQVNDYKLNEHKLICSKI